MTYALHSKGQLLRSRHLLIVALVAMSSSLAQASENQNELGYRNCDLQHLEACQNTNQMFVGLSARGWSSSYKKPELPAAIDRFLRGAPRINVLNYSFSASETVKESLWGPGSRYRFPSGEWLFTGFTPHAAPDRAAIIFDDSGHVLVIATLQPNMNVPPKGAYGGYPQDLTIYLHAPEPEGKFIERVIQWARDSVAERNKAYPEIPNDEMGVIRIVTAATDQQQWHTRVLK
jgi:hypothetical protein